jgi:hypothetical protein
LAIMGTWRSNNYLTPGAAYDSDERFATTPGMNLSVVPALTLKSRTSALHADVTAAYEARKYLSEELSNLDRFRNVNAKVGLTILPEAIVGAKLGSSFVVTGRETEAVNSDDAYLQQMTSKTQGTLTVRPGSSMEIDLGGTFDFRDIDTPPSVSPDGYNLNTSTGYGFVGAFNWRFFPKTAIVGSVERTIFNWDNNVVTLYDTANGPIDPNRYAGVLPFALLQDGKYVLYKPNGKQLKVEGGLRGRVTERLVVGVIGGFTRLVYDETLDDSFNAEERKGGCTNPDRGTEEAVGDDLVGFPCSFSGNLEATYEITKNQKVLVGYLRQHQDVFFTNYLSMNRVYASWSATLADRWRPGLGAEYNGQSYHGQVDRKDGWFRVKTDLAYRVLPVMDLQVGTWYTGRRSIGQEFGNVEYDDVNIHFGINAFY